MTKPDNSTQACAAMELLVLARGMHNGIMTAQMLSGIMVTICGWMKTIILSSNDDHRKMVDTVMGRLRGLNHNCGAFLEFFIAIQRGAHRVSQGEDREFVINETSIIVQRVFTDLCGYGSFQQLPIEKIFESLDFGIPVVKAA